MSILGNFLKNGIKIGSKIKNFKLNQPEKLQKKTLIKLLTKARNTHFGKHYNFEAILNNLIFEKDDIKYELFQNYIPIFDYDAIYDSWWHRSHEGEEDVCWPGKIHHFALSSGTSGAPSKHIPVSKEMIKAINKAGVNQIIALGNYGDLPPEIFEKSYLMLGGSTDLEEKNGKYEGDLSGITTGNLPVWFERFFKPGKEISKVKQWEQKIQNIADHAPEWDIAFLAGVPAWMQILLEKIIEQYNLKNIHEIWQNLTVYGWGGVSFEPYKQGFEKLLGKPLIYVETYLSSEGFIAYQERPEGGLKLVLNNGIFFEFVPFNDDNFDSDGKIKSNASAILLNKVKYGVDYAILISTCSGAWRYLIGDTIRFTDISRAEIKITGRTKHFLSLCGEHISVDNLNRAVELASQHFNVAIKEFTVIGKNHANRFAHHWYIGCNDPLDSNQLIEFIDAKLCELNDDYVVERKHALKYLFCEVLSTETFFNFMNSKGKIGGQNKFPRVLKGNQQKEWEEFLIVKNLLK
jgi:hypothetical protein